MKLLEILNSDKKIVIVSGEGELGRNKEYTGKRTALALKRHLTKESCNGDRWANASYLSHINHYDNTDEYDAFDDEVWISLMELLY